MNASLARPSKAFPADADPIADCLSAALYQIEKVMAGSMTMVPGGTDEE